MSTCVKKVARPSVWLLLVGALALAGCAVQSPDPKFLAQMAAMVYPKDAPLGEDYDIVVTQKGDSIKLNNRTPLAYTDVQIWLNQEYVRTIKEIRIGNAIGTNRFELSKVLQPTRRVVPHWHPAPAR